MIVKGLPWWSSGEGPTLPMQGVQVQFLVGKIRFHIRPGMAKKKKCNKLEQKFLVACLHSTWLQPLQHLSQKLVKFLYSVLVKFSENINVGRGNQNSKRHWQAGAMKWNIWDKIKSWVEILREKTCFTSTGLACQNSLWIRKGNLVDSNFSMCITVSGS